MVYSAFNATSPASTAGGPVTYQNPYYKTQCGCGSANPQVTMQPAGGVREGFTEHTKHLGDMPKGGNLRARGDHAPCTLTATAPPAGCCHPAPLHCDCCNGSGYFRASEAYGS